MGATATASEIEDVTIYARGARVRRVTSTGLAGSEIRIAGLPLGLADDTVRAEVIGGPGTVTGLRVELDAAGVTDRAGDAVDREVRATRARLVAAEAEVARLSAALQGLAALAPVARRPRPDGAVVPAWSKSLDARLAVLELRIGRETELRAAFDAAHRELVAAREAVAAAQDRSARASTGRGLRVHELCKVVIATVDGLDASARIGVEYLIGAARWAPTYCARLAGGKAELELRAVVAQSSGEDWTAARLTLSTAEPMRFAELPELPMARIGRRQPQVAKRGFRAPPTGVETLYQDFDRAFPRGTQRGRPKPFTDRHGPQDEITQERALAYEDALRLQAPELPPPAAEFDTDEAAVFGNRLETDDDFVELTESSTERAKTPPPSRRPAPPPAQMAPVPTLMAPQSRARSALAGIGVAAAAPFGAVAALSGAVAKAAGRKGGAPGGPRYEDPAIGGESDFFGDDAVALLAYAELRMMPAGDQRRGRLARVGVFAQYVEALAARGLSISAEADLATAIGDRTAAIDALVLPPGASGVWDHHYDHAFAGDAPVAVPSDGSWHAIAVTARTAPVAIRHVVVPREGTEVYRIAELANPLGAPLLPGPIDVFDDGVYLLTSRIDGVPAGAPVELGLGVDPKVKASRNSDYHEEASGVLRGSLKLEHEVTVEIANHSARPVDIEIRERLPVVTDGDDAIELTVIRTEPRWEKWAPSPTGPSASRLKGGHRWRITVPAAETRKLFASYSIRIAAKHELVGGNRRES